MITSTNNPLTKQVLKLQQKAGERRKSGLFVAEGRREVSLALKSGIIPAHILVCNELYTPDELYPVDLALHEGVLTEVSSAVYQKMAYRSDAEGIILVGHQANRGLSSLTLPQNPLLLVLEGLEKPGNLGAVLRTADAAGVDAVIFANAKADMYNPNVIRASLGCLFTLQVTTGSTEEAIRWFTEKKNWPGGLTPKVIAAALQTDRMYFDTDMRGPVVLAFGAEDEGLSAPWRKLAGQPVRIPMMGSIDSLNVAASVAILTYEAVRQRYSL